MSAPSPRSPSPPPGRLALGAAVLFYPYVFRQDLPRYKDARRKWLAEGMPAGLWWLKAQQETLTQVGHPRQGGAGEAKLF